MNYSIATDKQLKTIVNYDKGCSPHLLRGVVTEMLKRNLLDDLIYHIAMKLYRNVEVRLSCMNMDLEDLLQIGYMEIIKAAHNFKPGKSSFKSFAYMCIWSKLTKLARDSMSDTRKGEERKLSLDSFNEEVDDKTYIFLDTETNVERSVIRQMEWEEQMNKLLPRQREIIYYRLQGYSLRYLALNKYKVSGNVIHQQYKKALKKMGVAV